MPSQQCSDTLATVTTMLKNYSELIKYSSFLDRFRYLELPGQVGQITFGYDRWLNQKFYSSKEWKQFRRDIILRDNGCDLGVEGYSIFSGLIIHHMNPINPKDITEKDMNRLMNPEYVITTSLRTHNAIHYSNENALPQPIVERKPNDTCPWRR